MGGLGMALAGALSGFGTGMAEQGKINLAQRHAMAMERLRSDNQMAESTHTGQINDRNNAASQARGHVYDVGKTRVEIEGQIARDARTQAFQAGEKDKDRNFDAGQKSLDRLQQERMAKLNTQLDVLKQTYGTVITAAVQAGVKSGEIQSVERDNAGNFFAVKRDGTTQDLNVVGAPPASTSGIPGLDFGGGTAGGKPAPATPNTGLQRLRPENTPTKPAAGSKPATSAAAVPNFTTEAEAVAFVNNPNNKGKQFRFAGRIGTVN